MKKKILALAVGVLMAASLAGCSQGLSNKYITVDKYKGLEVPKVDTEKVTDKSVESVINSKLTSTATKEDVKDRAAKSGDTVNIDFKGSVDGKEFQGGSAEKQDLKLGSGQYIGPNGDYKGFEEQIVGHKAGDSFDITVQFPSNYTNKDMENKVAVFNTKLNSIAVEHVPELTDGWVKKNSKTSKTVEDYKKEVKKQLEDNNKKSAQNSLQKEVLDALLDQTHVKGYPEKEVDKQIKSINDYYQNMAKAYKLEFKDFIKQYLGVSEDDFNKQAKDAARMTVKTSMACELVAKKKNLIPSDKEYDKEIKKIASGAGFKNVQDFKKQVGEDVIKSTILQQKVVEYLADKCVQVEKPKTDKKASPAPAKESNKK